MALNLYKIQLEVIIPCSQYEKLNFNPSPKSNQIFKSSIHQSKNMTNKTLVRVGVGVWVRASIKIYIRHTENYYQHARHYTVKWAGCVH